MKEVAIQTLLTLVLGVIFGSMFVATTYGMKTYAAWAREREAERDLMVEGCLT